MVDKDKDKKEENEFLVDKEDEISNTEDLARQYEGEPFDNLENISIDDDLESFEEWDEGQINEESNDLGSLEEFETKSIEEDFADFEDQVVADQEKMAAQDARKQKSGGGVLKGLFTLVVLGGLVGGGYYGYVTYKDDINKLINGFEQNVGYMETAQTQENLVSSNATMPSTMPQPTPMTSEEVSDADQLQDFVDPMPVFDGAPEPVETEVAEPADPFGEMLSSPEDVPPSPFEITEMDAMAESEMPQPSPIVMPETIEAETVDDTAVPEMLETPEVVTTNVGTDSLPATNAPLIPTNQLEGNAATIANDASAAVDVTEQTAVETLSEVEETLVTDVPPVEPQANLVLEDTTIMPPVDEVATPVEEAVAPMIETEEGVLEEAVVVEENTVASSENTAEPAIFETPSNVVPAMEEPVEEVLVETKPVQAPKTVAKKLPVQTTDKNIYETAKKDTTVYNLIQTQDLRLARNAASDGRYADAMAIYDRLVKLNPTNYESLMGRAATLEYMGRREEAIAAYSRVLQVSPNDTRARESRDRLMASGVREAAPAVVAPRPQASPPVQPAPTPRSAAPAVTANTPVSAQAAIALANAGQHQQAMAMIDKVRMGDPDNALHAYTAAIIHDRAGDRARAVRLYEEALTLDVTYGSPTPLPRGQIYDRLSVIR